MAVLHLDIFTIYTSIQAPEKFNAFISLSPTVGYCPEFLRESIEKNIKNIKANDNSLFITYGLTREMKEVKNFIPDFYEFLNNNFDGWSTKLLSDKNGSHCPKGGIKKGLDFIYKK